MTTCATTKYIQVKEDSKQIQELDWGDYKTYTVWECGSIIGTHSTITTRDGKWYGRLGTRQLPANLEELPAMTDYRINKVREFRYRILFP